MWGKALKEWLKAKACFDLDSNRSRNSIWIPIEQWIQVLRWLKFRVWKLYSIVFNWLHKLLNSDYAKPTLVWSILVWNELAIYRSDDSSLIELVCLENMPSAPTVAPTQQSTTETVGTDRVILFKWIITSKESEQIESKWLSNDARVRLKTLGLNGLLDANMLGSERRPVGMCRSVQRILRHRIRAKHIH